MIGCVSTATATTPVPYSPAYRRYTPEMAESLIRISAGLAVIGSARILPAVADQLRASARVGTVHFSNLIEGNQLPLIEAERATRGELKPDSRAKIELLDYVEALDLIDERVEAGTLELVPRLLLDLHATAMRGLGRPDDPHFKPHHEGAWRDGQAVVFDHLSGRVMHEGPPPDEVEPRMLGLFEWLRKALDGQESPFVVAGVVHYAITDVHPFADGNGRAARLFQTAVLMSAGVLPGRMFSFERYYAEDRNAYYSALRSVRNRTLNMEFWLDYVLRGLAEEYERVSATVADLGALIAGGTGAPLRLSPAQERAIAALRLAGRSEFTRRDYEKAAAVGRSTAGDDLRELVRHGVVVTRGAGPATRYLFATAATTGRNAGRGRPRKWTDSLIERELRGFLHGRTKWPSPTEFRAAGKGALYAAAARSGGISRWRRMMGL